MTSLPIHEVDGAALSAREIDAYICEARRLRNKAIGDAGAAAGRVIWRASAAVARTLSNHLVRSGRTVVGALSGRVRADRPRPNRQLPDANLSDVPLAVRSSC